MGIIHEIDDDEDEEEAAGDAYLPFFFFLPLSSPPSPSSLPSFSFSEKQPEKSSQHRRSAKLGGMAQRRWKWAEGMKESINGR
jgi:hypothetical protein